MKVIFNGQLVEHFQTPCDEKGWLPGTGLFETIKTVDGKAWALSRHMRRVINSSRGLKITLPSESQLRNSIDELLTATPFSLGLLRISFDHNGDWCAAHLEYQERLGPARLVLYPHSLPKLIPAVKSYPYNHRINILEYAHLHNADEALVSNIDEKICEGSVSNILMKIGDQWMTPPLSDGVLPGVMRALVIEYCSVTVKSIATGDLSKVQSAILLSSLRIAQPVTSIEGRELEQSLEFVKEIQAMALRTSVG